MPEFSSVLLSVAKSSLFSKRAAQEQGGLLDGQDPTQFNTADPLRLWIIQLGVIIGMAQFLAFFLRKLRQPKVIAEVLGGILLGPTAFGRIPGFTEHIFPSQSLPYLSLVANIGLVLFLFLVGLEIDTSVIKKNARFSLPIALGGMTLPFGLGAALAVPLYNQFTDSSVKFTHFMLFTAVAYSITAFPVLCRILTELKLMDTTVGIVVLSAGVGNDIVGWTLLALSVALVNAASGLMALWILLTALGWTLLLLFPVRRFFLWLAHRTGSIENGPTMFFMTITILMTFGSAFFTDVIGVHAIFGGFLAGLVVPREGNLAITLTEKLEDMVSIIFLPLYFTISGLSTNLGLLDNGITWGYTIAICVLAYFGKFGGCTVAARFTGFSWREASTIGTLMSCKGLVELIVLNVGLSAGILSPRVFAMFVLEALTLTFMTTPIATLLYPPHLRKRISLGPDYDAMAPAPKGDERAPRPSITTSDYRPFKTRFTVVLDRLEHLPGMMTMAQLIQTAPDAQKSADRTSTVGTITRTSSESSSVSRAGKRPEGIIIDAHRIIELSDRTSAVMKSSAWDVLTQTDPLLGIFKTFGHLNDMHIFPSLSIVSYDDLAPRVAEHASSHLSQLVLVPWLPPTVPITTTSAEGQAPATPSHVIPNPFDAMFKNTAPDHAASAVHSQFIRGVFHRCKTDVALFVDCERPGNGETSGRDGKHHLFLPFFGGPDDRLALEFVVQLCANPKITATVVKVSRLDQLSGVDGVDRPSAVHLTPAPTLEHDPSGATTDLIYDDVKHGDGVSPVTPNYNQDTMYKKASAQARLESSVQDGLMWERYAQASKEDQVPPAVAEALNRIEFNEVTTSLPLHHVIEEISSQLTSSAQNEQRLFVVLGRSRRLPALSHHHELKGFIEEHGGVSNEVKKTIGDVATALVVSGCQAGLVVVQRALTEDK